MIRVVYTTTSGRGPARSGLGETPEHGGHVVERFAAPLRSAQRDRAFRRRDHRDGERSGIPLPHAARDEQLGYPLGPGPKDRARMIKQLRIVGGDRDGKDGAAC